MSTRVVVTGWILLGFCATGSAQVNIERFERRLEQIRRDTLLRVDTTVSADQRALLDYGALVSFNFFAIDDALQDTHILRQTESLAYLRLNVDNVHEIFASVRSTYNDWNAGDAFDTQSDDWVEPTLDRGFYRFDLARAIAAYQGRASDFNVVVTGGRQLAHWATGLTLSQEIDGGIMTVTLDKIAVELVAGRTRPSSADFDSSRPRFNGDTNRHFYGGMVSWQVTPRYRPFVYALVQDDHNSRDFDSDPLKLLRSAEPTSPFLPTSFDYESHYFGVGVTGSRGDQILYTVEFVYQGGEGLSNSFTIDFLGDAVPIMQTRENIEAYALDARLDYLFNDPNRTRAVFEVVFATGDDDRFNHTSNTFGGNAPGTKDMAFNSFGLTNTGLAFVPNVSNLIMVRAGIATFPSPEGGLFEKLQIGTDLFVFNKYDQDAPIDEPSTSTTYLGLECDFFANWQIAADLTWTVRYGLFFPGEGIDLENDERHFVFTGITYAF